MDLWQFGGVELESKALTKISREEGDCASQLSVLFILVARKRLHRENALFFPFYEAEFMILFSFCVSLTVIQEN